MIPSPPYRALARHYDGLMAHVDYRRWSRYLRSLWARHGIVPGRVLELAAGTCSFHAAGLYRDAAFTVFLDRAPEMLHAGGAKGAGRRVAADLRALPLRRGFDTCLLLYDSINYMLTEEDLCRCLVEIHGVLKPGGWLIFDTATQYNSLRYFLDETQCEEMEGCTLIRHSHWDEEREFQHNDFIYFEPRPDGSYERREEAHVQRIYSEEAMRQAVVECGFTLEGVYQGYTFRPTGPRAERVHWVARKA